MCLVGQLTKSKRSAQIGSSTFLFQAKTSWLVLKKQELSGQGYPYTVEESWAKSQPMQINDSGKMSSDTSVVETKLRI